MRHLAAVFAAAVLGSGCIITTTDTQGSVNLYWDFVRNAPAQTGGYVIYDSSFVGSGTGTCPESGVEVVEFVTPAGTSSVSCVYGGVQGVTIDGLSSGSRSFTVRGWRRVGGVDQMVYEKSVQVNVVGGSTVDAYVDVEPVVADVDVVAYLNNVDTTDSVPDFTYQTCNDAANPTLTYALYDSYGTLVDQVGNLPCPPGASALALPALIGTLDVDTYTIRMQGFTGGGATRTFDSCPSNANRYLAFDHFVPHTGASAIEIDLYTPPACTAL